MKYILLILLVSTTITFAGPGHGHSHGHDGHGHDHAVKKSIDQKQVRLRAMEQVMVLIEKKKIDNSWNKATFDSAKLIDFNGKKEWKVIFTNDKGVKGKKLYLFLKHSGEFVAANFTGK